MNGLSNYYSFANNKARLQFIQYILYHSCVKLFGRKLKLHSRSIVFSKFGKGLTVTEEIDKKKKSYKFKLKSSFKRTGKFLINPAEPLDVVYYSMRSKSILDQNCSICNSDTGIEMHHVKALKSAKTSGFITVMINMNRKQIPVCKSCHVKIHNGTYDGLKLKDLPLSRKK
jgi:hypothetical protein